MPARAPLPCLERQVSSVPKFFEHAWLVRVEAGATDEVLPKTLEFFPVAEIEQFVVVRWHFDEAPDRVDEIECKQKPILCKT